MVLNEDAGILKKYKFWCLVVVIETVVAAFLSFIAQFGSTVDQANTLDPQRTQSAASLFNTANLFWYYICFTILCLLIAMYLRHRKNNLSAAVQILRIPSYIPFAGAVYLLYLYRAFL